MQAIKNYAKLVKFSHTVFAMPFAIVGFAYALATTPEKVDNWWVLLLQVILCMVFARNAAMGFNRWLDRDIDAENPRTKDREIPRGVVSPKSALFFVVANALLFVVVAITINLTTALLSPVALVVILGYSYCKRFTSLSHIVLGLGLSIAPVGAYIAVTGTLALAPCVLALLVMTWCAGFDIIYALQDANFDREKGLHSIPQHFTSRDSLLISTALHLVSLGAMVWFCSFLPQSKLLWTGQGSFAAMLVMQHILVLPSQQKHIGIAFGTLNGIASLIFAFFTVLNIWLYM